MNKDPINELVNTIMNSPNKPNKEITVDVGNSKITIRNNEESKEEEDSIYEDPNMNLETTKLKAVNEYINDKLEEVNNQVDNVYTTGSIFPEKVSRSEYGKDEEKPYEYENISIDLFSRIIVNHEFSDFKGIDESKNIVQLLITNIFKSMGTSSGRLNFLLYYSHDVPVSVCITIQDDESIKVSVGGRDYILNRTEENSQTEECEEEDNKTLTSADEENEERIRKLIESAEIKYNRDRENIMNHIEDHLPDTIDEGDPYDLSLVKYYLRQLPYNSLYDIESMSDNSIRLAWNQRQYRRGKI